MSRHNRTGHAPEGRGPAHPPRSSPATDRIVALFVLGVLLLNYPLLSLIDRSDGGVPWLWLGLFLFWAAFIVLIRLLHSPSGRSRRRD